LFKFAAGTLVAAAFQTLFGFAAGTLVAEAF
jgi:hypothetical protein